MQGFEANNCRLCEKVFCCEKCRIEHEDKFHKVFPDCDICIYGNCVFGSLEVPYLQHLESSHLPLNCVYCTKIFTSIEEIIQHKKCPVLQQKNHSPETSFNQRIPGILILTTDQDSPILQELQRTEPLNYMFNLATSTPMQKGQESNAMFQKSEEPFTPVDDKLKLINKSIIKKTDSLKADNSSKRRVTFGEIPTNKSIMLGDKNIPSVNSSTKFVDHQISETHTPVTGISNEQFYSAKSEIDQFHSAKAEAFSMISKERLTTERFTPVCIPSMSKMIKGNIYKTPDLETSSTVEQKNDNIEDPKDMSCNQESNLDEVSMDICTPARFSDPVKKQGNNFSTKPEENSTEKPNDWETKVSIIENCLKVAAEGATYNNSEQANDPPTSAEDHSSDKENKFENDYVKKKSQITDVNAGNTLWLSAINSDDSNNSKELSNEIERPDDENQIFKNSNSPESSPNHSKRRVSIVMPTPILKRTNVHMKFHIPAHFSSTPIMSSGVMKIKQTKIVEGISAKVINQQTPFKTPRGRLPELTQERFILGSNVPQSLETFSDTDAGPSRRRNEIVPFPENDGNYICKDITTCHSNRDLAEIPVTGVSVSSMTESTLWSSVTHIVKSVLGFTNMSSQDSNLSVSKNSVSFKRQLSDPDSFGDFLEAPRLKRFKFTDIKCRKPIRSLPALEAPRRLTASAGQIATFEIVKSVSTIYGGSRMKIQCNKATQTDDYLMYGWYPKM